MNLRDEWAKVNEAKIKEIERTTYSGDMPTHNKQSIRHMFNLQDRYEFQRLQHEEDGHSHSAVGDQFNMGGNRE